MNADESVDRPGGDALERPPDGEYRVHSVDAGAGQAVLVDAGDEVLVYDGGPHDDTGVDGRGTRALTAVLDGLGVETVDHAVVSHLDGDHVGGLAGLLEDGDYDVGALHLPDVLGLDVRPRAFPQVRDLLCAADDRDLSVNLLRGEAVGEVDHDPTRGEPAFSVGEVDVYALGPADWPGAGRDPRDHAETAGQTTNQASVVAYLDHEAGDGLLTGDAEDVPARQVAARYDLSGAVWAQPAHHAGVWSGGHLLAAADPDVVTLTGRSEAHGHPHVQRLLDAAALDPDAVVGSEADGWSTLTVSADGVGVETARGSPGSATDLLRRYHCDEGETPASILRTDPWLAGTVAAQAAERTAGGRVAALAAAAGGSLDGVVEAGRGLADLADESPAFETALVDATLAYARDGDPEALVESVVAAAGRNQAALRAIPDDDDRQQAADAVRALGAAESRETPLVDHETDRPDRGVTAYVAGRLSPGTRSDLAAAREAAVESRAAGADDRVDADRLLSYLTAGQEAVDAVAETVPETVASDVRIDGLVADDGTPGGAGSGSVVADGGPERD